MIAFIRDALATTRLPKVTINLMREKAASNDPFYLRLVENFYYRSIAPHPRYRVIAAFTRGVALCNLRSDDKPYAKRIESSGLRNVKKAVRLGYRFGSLDYNVHLNDIAAIRRSTTIRQGPVPTKLLHGEVKPVRNPKPLNDYHRYEYFGVFRDGTLFAYAGCFIAGEICMLEHIYGHAAHHSDGIVPQLIAGIAEFAMSFSQIQYYSYDTTFGAGESRRRFKKKFLFYPHNVCWTLG